MFKVSRPEFDQPKYRNLRHEDAVKLKGIIL